LGNPIIAGSILDDVSDGVFLKKIKASVLKWRTTILGYVRDAVMRVKASGIQFSTYGAENFSLFSALT
jgi:hypothetical protein